LVLPVGLIDFSTEYEDNDFVKLKWLTASEKNNDYFTIERSPNGIKWDPIINVDRAGNSSKLLSYSAIDQSPFRGISYYRLKQTDFDGKFEYSEIRSVNIEKSENAKIEIYPNPVKNYLTIEGNEDELNSIKIYNLLGQDVTDLTKTIVDNSSKRVIDLSRLNQGIYGIKSKSNFSKILKL